MTKPEREELHFLPKRSKTCKVGFRIPAYSEIKIHFSQKCILISEQAGILISVVYNIVNYQPCIKPAT